MAEVTHRWPGALGSVPGICALRTYERAWLRADLAAGVVLAARSCWPPRSVAIDKAVQLRRLNRSPHDS